MKNYMSILVAVDLNLKEDEELILKALKLAKNSDAKVYIVHVVDTAGNYGMASPQILLDSIENNQSNARKVLSELGARFEIPKESQIVKVGLVKEVIVDLVKNINADLLLMGNHGRHGILASFIYNNTVNLVKNVDCDMIAVWVA
ncbi:MAG: universal stress protein [Oligoflexales bacterium]